MRSAITPPPGSCLHTAGRQSDDSLPAALPSRTRSVLRTTPPAIGPRSASLCPYPDIRLFLLSSAQWTSDTAAWKAMTGARGAV